MEEDSSAAYIRMVQHLIEKCLMFRMSQEECAEALSTHANILPQITNTVWKELEKENKEFFRAYANDRKATATTELSRKEVDSYVTPYASLWLND